jgi:hypothetical protein
MEELIGGHVGEDETHDLGRIEIGRHRHGTRLGDADALRVAPPDGERGHAIPR